MIIDGKKYACQKCIRGHRVTTCNHSGVELVLIKPKGRPSTTCEHCKAVRHNTNFNPMGKCQCGKNVKPIRVRRRSKASISSISNNTTPMVTPASSLMNDCDCLSGSICKCNVTKRKASVVSLTGHGSGFVNSNLNRKSISSYISSPNLVHREDSFSNLFPTESVNNDLSLEFTDNFNKNNREKVDDSGVSLMDFFLNTDKSVDQKIDFNNYPNTSPVSPTTTSFIDNVVGEMNIAMALSNNSSFLNNDDIGLPSDMEYIGKRSSTSESISPKFVSQPFKNDSNNNNINNSSLNTTQKKHFDTVTNNALVTDNGGTNVSDIFDLNNIFNILESNDVPATANDFEFQRNNINWNISNI
ncbi:hypothetical protein TPHA_0H00580 [Tetrapisispora phaffii CBS 4417]|uniref:Copper-fist domain-containing protein n=1 Tax=Tetrapisispora phaffii (strain ATCC 24235 / CBS 4417 / NBRC 1672 / NRRL Y-8282 / UCD 70-5) TaxID=1071381 RepID=G8BWW4_TETPH|nr:hypothetical protein TPHA_0H00580 [Tetrapisispora phaffii CBS 4417]CCE64268.1 hypothetical protein TPHA_0H00580 [Tetrapisispora phaffii CBS 4417]